MIEIHGERSSGVEHEYLVTRQNGTREWVAHSGVKGTEAFHTYRTKQRDLRRLQALVASVHAHRDVNVPGHEHAKVREYLVTLADGRPQWVPAEAAEGSNAFNAYRTSQQSQQSCASDTSMSQRPYAVAATLRDSHGKTPSEVIELAHTIKDALLSGMITEKQFTDKFPTAKCWDGRFLHDHLLDNCGYAIYGEGDQAQRALYDRQGYWHKEVRNTWSRRICMYI